MKISFRPGLLLALLVAALPATAAVADSEDAFCEVRVDGEQAADASGYCTVTQNHGHVVIRLADGESYDLEPDGDTGYFRDRNGERVERKARDDGSQVYRWADRDVTVYFDRSEGIYH